MIWCIAVAGNWCGTGVICHRVLGPKSCLFSRLNFTYLLRLKLFLKIIISEEISVSEFERKDV